MTENPLRQHTYPSGQRLEFVRGDLTAQDVDAIVNPANENLLHGGGVAALIAKRGGRAIDDESRAWVRKHSPVPHDRPAYTSAGNLSAGHVIHAVGPVWGSGEEDRKLAAAVQGSLARASELGLASLALPAISTGIFGFPKDRAAGVIYGALADYFNAHPDYGVSLVRLVLYDQPTLDAFLAAWDSLY